MNKIFATAALSLLTIMSFAQKLGHTDGQSLLLALPERTTIEEKLQKVAREYETTLSAMKADYDAKIKEFETNRNTWPEAILQSKAKAITDLEQNMYDLQQTANDDLDKQQMVLLKPLIDKVNNAIDKVAMANGYTYIFDAGVGALLYKGGDDVTDLVKAELGVTNVAPKK
jgi:outer membrane protein